MTQRAFVRKERKERKGERRLDLHEESPESDRARVRPSGSNPPRPTELLLFFASFASFADKKALLVDGLDVFRDQEIRDVT
jgi:hypothetical protein